MNSERLVQRYPDGMVERVARLEMRDPFEISVGADTKSLLSYAGALAAPSTAYLYHWNLLSIGQLLWEKKLMSYKEFPPPATSGQL